jgi:predicted nucleotidyltransferase
METTLIEKLKEYFSQRKDIAFAFLYGSHAKGSANKLSDVDIAVYFYPLERHPIEFEKEVFYDAENEIWGDLQRILKEEVELLVLNRVSASVAASAIRGIPLSTKDWGLYLDFMEVITDVAQDFTELVISDYKERTKFERRE